MSFEVRNLVKSYGEKVVVDHLNLKMDRPGVYALLGTNGAGKTTSIRMILGMLQKDSGEVLFDGKEMQPKQMNIGYLAEERGLYPKYPIIDQLLYFARLKGVKRSEAMNRIKHWSTRLELDEYLFPPKNSKGKAPKPKLADQLSKGNQQKVQLMAALISDPEFLILDEPMSGLDPVNTDLFKEVIREEIAKDKYVIMSSHQMPTVEEFCTDITILDHGKTVLQGNLDEIKKSYGRVNLFVKCEGEIEDLIEKAGLPIVEKLPSEYHIRVTGEEQAMQFLRSLIDANNSVMGRKITIIRFELREPSLHEIFVEKVGGNTVAEEEGADNEKE
ncbi:MAG: ATP-binding cassette domain-containing protein [Lachnospiraceae bacterium]|nr:ATP-binding cassette domain-containing protein [Lachnospiraceae bacterium]